MKVYKFNSNSESYDLVASIKDDGTIIGESTFAARVEEILTRIEEEGVARADVIDDVKQIVENRYNTGQYVTER
jgi:hypothetical protein